MVVSVDFDRCEKVYLPGSDLKMLWMHPLERRNILSTCSAMNAATSLYEVSMHYLSKNSIESKVSQSSHASTCCFIWNIWYDIFLGPPFSNPGLLKLQAKSPGTPEKNNRSNQMSFTPIVVRCLAAWKSETLHGRYFKPLSKHWLWASCPHCSFHSM